MPSRRYTPWMAIPTESIGSIPRPPQLIQAMTSFHGGKMTAEALNNVHSEALRDTIHRLEQTGSPILTDGEQTKPSFAQARPRNHPQARETASPHLHRRHRPHQPRHRKRTAGSRPSPRSRILPPGQPTRHNRRLRLRTLRRRHLHRPRHRLPEDPRKSRRNRTTRPPTRLLTHTLTF
jgi:hypothetical protein